MTGSEMYVRLRNLCNKAGVTHYDRIKLASELLQDRGWVTSPDGGGGDENQAIDRLEKDCFGDLVGLIHLPNLLELYHNVPDIEDWQKARFDLKKIWSDWKSRQTPKKVTKTEVQYRATKDLTPPLSFPELTPAQAKKEYTRVYQATETQAEKIVRLEDRVAVLEKENATLKEEISRYKKGARELFKIA